MTQEIKGEDYVVHYDENSVIVKFQGELALGGPKEYAPINDLLAEVVDGDPSEMTLNLKELSFLLTLLAKPNVGMLLFSQKKIVFLLLTSQERN